MEDIKEIVLERINRYNGVWTDEGWVFVGDFYLDELDLPVLPYIKSVDCYFSCSKCPELKNLIGAPREVGGDFDCSYCPNLISLEGAPREVSRDFYCDKRFTIEDVKKVCNVKGRIYNGD